MIESGSISLPNGLNLMDKWSAAVVALLRVMSRENYIAVTSRKHPKSNWKQGHMNPMPEFFNWIALPPAFVCNPLPAT